MGLAVVSLQSMYIFLKCDIPNNSEKKMNHQKQPSRGVLRKRCSENMQQIYRRTPSKCSFNIEMTLRHGCFAVNLLHILRTPFTMNTYERLLLNHLNKWLIYSLDMKTYIHRRMLHIMTRKSRISDWELVWKIGRKNLIRIP